MGLRVCIAYICMFRVLSKEIRHLFRIPHSVVNTKKLDIDLKVDTLLIGTSFRIEKRMKHIYDTKMELYGRSRAQLTLYDHIGSPYHNRKGSRVSQFGVNV